MQTKKIKKRKRKKEKKKKHKKNKRKKQKICKRHIGAITGRVKFTDVNLSKSKNNVRYFLIDSDFLF